MTTGEGRNKDRFKNWKLCVLWKSPFRHYGTITLTQICVCFNNPCINPSVPDLRHSWIPPKKTLTSLLAAVYFRSLAEYLPWACCETKYLHFIVLIFVPARSHAAENRSNACWRSCWEDPSMHAVPIRPQKTNGSSCSSQQWHPRRRICGCLSISYRQELSKFFGIG